jgi:hypothetical protein
MIGTLLYLTAIWPYIQFAVCLFNESSGISSTNSSLGFGILLLLRWIL